MHFNRILVSVGLAGAVSAGYFVQTDVARAAALPPTEARAARIGDISVTEPFAKDCKVPEDTGKIVIHSSLGSPNVASIWFCAQAPNRTAHWFKATGTAVSGAL